MNNKISQATGVAIRQKRISLGLSAAQLGKLINLTKASISKMETGKQFISIDNLTKISSALKCTSITELLPTTKKSTAIVSKQLTEDSAALNWIKSEFKINVNEVKSNMHKNKEVEYLSNLLSSPSFLSALEELKRTAKAFEATKQAHLSHA